MESQGVRIQTNGLCSYDFELGTSSTIDSRVTTIYGSTMLKAHVR